MKLFVGAGGEKIKWIQRKSKCRVQVCGVEIDQCSCRRCILAWGKPALLTPAA